MTTYNSSKHEMLKEAMDNADPHKTDAELFSKVCLVGKVDAGVYEGLQLLQRPLYSALHSRHKVACVHLQLNGSGTLGSPQHLLHHRQRLYTQ